MGKRRIVELAIGKPDDAHTVSQQLCAAGPQITQQRHLGGRAGWHLSKGVAQQRCQRIHLGTLWVGGQHHVFPTGLPARAGDCDGGGVVDGADVYVGGREHRDLLRVDHDVVEAGNAVEIGIWRKGDGLLARVIGHHPVGLRAA